MGQGYSYKCEKCGKKYDVMLGVGMLFPNEYQNVVRKIRAGRYGAEWKKKFMVNEYMAVNAENELYVCECGSYHIVSC